MPCCTKTLFVAIAVCLQPPIVHIHDSDSILCDVTADESNFKCLWAAGTGAAGEGKGVCEGTSGQIVDLYWRGGV